MTETASFASDPPISAQPRQGKILGQQGLFDLFQYMVLLLCHRLCLQLLRATRGCLLQHLPV